MSQGTRPMRVLVVHNRYRSEEPSGENQVVDQEVELLRTAGHAVEMFERNSDDIDAMSLRERAGIVARIPWSRPSLLDFETALRRFRPDVVHLHNTFPLISPSVLSATTDSGVPVVATLHHYRQICPSGTLFRDGQFCDECIRHRNPMPAIRHGCYRDSPLSTVPLVLSTVAGARHWWTKVAAFWCVSHAQRHLLIAGGMPPERLLVKYNFVQDHGVGRSGPGRYILFLSRLVETKGVSLLMEAWERLTASGPYAVPLVIVGTGPMADEVRRWADRRPDVQYLGFLPNDRCRALTQSAAAVAAPSLWAEPFGLVAVEAMSCGVAVVAAAHGAFPEIVADGVTGILHHPGDPQSLADALRVLADPSTSQRMGGAARIRYEELFSPTVGLANLTAGYEAVIAGTGLSALHH